jgi:nucleotide-binding universal stress UspA family protein
MAVGAVPIDMMIGMLPAEMRDAEQRVLDEVVGEIETEVEIRTVVLGSRGAGPITAALLGSVGAYCVHHASCPVVVLRDEDGVTGRCGRSGR